jgi:hypothetical protein
MSDTDSTTGRTEVFRVNGDQVVNKVKEIVSEGNVRRIVLKTADGKTLMEVPLTVGIAGLAVGVAIAPFLTAIGTVVALLAKVNTVVERVDDSTKPTKTDNGTM